MQTGPAKSKVLHIYLVRHAESANNSRDEHDQHAPAVDSSPGPPAKRQKTEDDATPAEPAAPSCREPDPGLTSRGKAQADAVAQLLRRIRDDPKTNPRLRPKRIFVSGFRRALETCIPVAQVLGLTPELQNTLHEEGGVFEGPRRGIRRDDYPLRHGMSGPQMCELLPNLGGTENVPERGWWDGGQEMPEKAHQRAKECADWLWKLTEEIGSSDSNEVSADDGAVVCVSHGNFMDRLIKALSGIEPGLGSLLFMTYNCSYWLVQLHLNPHAENPRLAVMAACNVVDHVPMAIRTGHSIRGVAHCQPSYDGADD